MRRLAVIRLSAVSAALVLAIVLLLWPRLVAGAVFACFEPSAGAWWWQVVFGRTGLQVAGVIVGSLLALWLAAGLARLMAPVTRPRLPRIHADQSGTAMLEFVLLLPWALFIFLILIQAGLMYNANFHVGYGAFCAARSAMVWAWPVPETREQKAAVVRYPLQASEGSEVPVFEVSKLPELRTRPRSAAIFACLPIAGIGKAGVPFWQCACGDVHEGPNPPGQCPNCGAGSQLFSQISTDTVGSSHYDAWKSLLGTTKPDWLGEARLSRKYGYASGWAHSQRLGPVLLTQVDVKVQPRPAPLGREDPGWKYFYDPGCESWRAQLDKPRSCGGGSGWHRCHGTETIEGEYPWESQVVVDFTKPPLEKLAEDPREVRVPLTVRLTHRFQLRVPYASRILRDGVMTYPKGRNRFSYVEMSAAYTVLTEGQHEHKWDYQ